MPFITSRNFAPITLREFILVCLANGWENKHVLGLARLYRKTYPRDCLFVVKYGRHIIGEPYPTFAAARRWALWNYKGQTDGWQIVPVPPRHSEPQP